MSALINGTLTGVVFQENSAVLGWVEGSLVFVVACILSVVVGAVIAYLCFREGRRACAI